MNDAKPISPNILITGEQPIGVFDSGIGGLSLVRHIRARLPAEDILYVADSAHAPYGERTRDFIQQRSILICRFFQRQRAKAIVVACNTATAAAVEYLRKEIDLPIIAMEPAIKPAALESRSGVIGVLATAGTLNSERYAALVNVHGDKVRVLERVCHHWVEHLENSGPFDPSSKAREAMVAAVVEPLVSEGADHLVLGCTHFPFLQSEIQKAAGKSVQLVDPGPAVVKQLSRRLEDLGLLNPKLATGSVSVWSSGQRPDEAERVSYLLSEGIRFKRFME